MSELFNDSFNEINRARSTEKKAYVGNLRILGVIAAYYDGTTPVGYVVLNEKTSQYKAYTIEQTILLIRKFGICNAAIEGNKIVNTECSMDRLPVFSEKLQIIKNAGITLIAEIRDKDKKVGYRVVDPAGRIANLTNEQIVTAVQKNDIKVVNAKVVNDASSKAGASTIRISAIKTTFPIISVESSSNMNSVRRQNIKAVKWRNEKHRGKIVRWCTLLFKRGMRWKDADNITLPHSLWHYKASDKNVTESLKPGLNLGKTIEIIRKEILPQVYEKDPSSKMIIEPNIHKLLDTGVDKDTVVTDLKNGISKDAKVYLVGLCQFVLLMDDCKVKANNVVKSWDDITESGALQQLKREKLLLAETKQLAVNANAIHKEWLKHKDDYKKRIWTTDSFKTAEECAQLGFALSERNKGLEFTTKTGSKYHLKYIGDYIPEEIGGYEHYKKMATCLGDVLIIANMERMYTLCKISKGNISYEQAQQKIEMMLAILAIYNPALAKEYIEKCMESGLHPEAAGYLPDFNFDDNLDFQLDDKIRLYYESGCNVFYSDKNSKDHKRRYLKEAEIINYRSQGVYVRCVHPLLTEELATVVNMITSEQCSAKAVTKYIGCLRAL